MKHRSLLAGASLLMLAAAFSAPVAAWAADTRTPLYWQDPDGKPEFSSGPKKTPDGRDYVPVYEDQSAKTAPAAPPAAQPAKAGQKRGPILFYRNPMVPTDTSPVPRKDNMGMDYIPVYANEAAGAARGIVTVAPGRLQMLGVRTAPVERRAAPVGTVRASGTLAFNERTLAVATARTEGWVKALHVASAGETVRKGEVLAEIYAPDIAATEREYAVAGGGFAGAALSRLRALGTPDEEIARLRRTGRPARTVAVRAPEDGVVIEKMVTLGTRVAPDQPLYRLADPSVLWLIAEVAERDLASVGPGSAATARFVAFPGKNFAGTVELIAPSLSERTRTASVRIALPNANGLLRAGMYADVSIGPEPGTSTPATLVVPDSAVLDDGTHQVVLVALGEGRFEPRSVRIGRRGEGEAQVLDGLHAGENVVVGANFLIDSESNLRAALKGFSEGAGAKAP